MIYRGMQFTISEIGPDQWYWTVKLSDTLERTGIAHSQSKAELETVRVIDRAIEIRSELTRRQSANAAQRLSSAYGRQHRSVRTLDLKQAIELRWTLRDIRGKRWKISTIDENHLKTLIEMGLVEMRGEEPFLTNVGLNVIV